MTDRYDVYCADTIIAAHSEAVSGPVIDSAMIAVVAKDARKEELLVKKYEMKENASTTTTTTKTTTTTTTTKDNIDINLELLPPLVIGHLALFLPRSSRALLGAALTPSVQCNWTNDDWKILDFSDLDKDLAAKLTDDDLYSVLKWIDEDANNRLRILKLTRCVNIIGHGLRILHGAINFGKIDLSLVGRRESPIVVPAPALAQADVLPILSHLVKSKHLDIIHIQLPKHWRIIENNSGLKQFFALYSKSLSKEWIDCFKCSKDICKGGIRLNWINENGLQKFTCYQCMNCFCTQCDADFCGTCEKLLCGKCGPVFTCDSCSKKVCYVCKPMGLCDDCDKILCDECCPVNYCDGQGCRKATCMDCATPTQGVWRCEACEITFCPDCRLDKYRKNRDEFCLNCQGTLSPAFSGRGKRVVAPTVGRIYQV